MLMSSSGDENIINVLCFCVGSAFFVGLLFCPEMKRLPRRCAPRNDVQTKQPTERFTSW
jgi:hypothetical protein